MQENGRKGSGCSVIVSGAPGEHIEGLGCGLGPVAEFQEPLMIGDTPLQLKGSYFGLKNAVVCLSVGVGHC